MASVSPFTAYGASYGARAYARGTYLRQVLMLNALARNKLAARSDTTREIEEIIANAGFLTVVRQPDAANPARWHVMTRWDADSHQIADTQSKR